MRVVLVVKAVVVVVVVVVEAAAEAVVDMAVLVGGFIIGALRRWAVYVTEVRRIRRRTICGNTGDHSQSEYQPASGCQG